MCDIQGVLIPSEQGKCSNSGGAADSDRHEVLIPSEQGKCSNKLKTKLKTKLLSLNPFGTGKVFKHRGMA